MIHKQPGKRPTTLEILKLKKINRKLSKEEISLYRTMERNRLKKLKEANHSRLNFFKVR